MASSTDFLPSRESELVTFASLFNDKIGAAPTTYGLNAGQATAFGVLFTSFNDAYETAKDPSSRTPSAIIAKDNAKSAMIDNIRMLARIVQATPTVTDEQKSDLGLTVRSAPTPIPPPAGSPNIDVLSVSGNTVRIRMHDPVNTTVRGKPPMVAGLTVFSFVGAAAPSPTEAAQWKFEMNTTKTVVDITFPTAAPGAKVWFTAFYRNERDQSGPAADPVGTNIAGGGAMAA